MSGKRHKQIERGRIDVDQFLLHRNRTDEIKQGIRNAEERDEALQPIV